MHDEADCRHLKASTRSFHILAASLVLALSGLICTGAIQAEHTVDSPDGNVVVTFDVKNVGDRQNCLMYTVTYKSQPIVVDSRLGLAIKYAALLETGFDIVNVSRSNSDSTYSPVYGEFKTIRDRYNQLIVELKESHRPYRRLQLTFRAYNEGAAFCYTLPHQEALQSFVISAEKTQFRFTANHSAYAVYSAQGQYSKVPLSDIKNNCERPLTIQINKGLFASVAEARLVDYARMRLSPDKGQAHTVVSSLASEVDAVAPFTTPWRVIMLGRTPGELLERNYLIMNLNEPCAIKDTSWIKPGKVIREVTLTTAGGMACVDFAVEHNLQYVEFDAGWYGHEYSEESDARTISVDPKRSKGPLDLHAVIKYAKQRDIGIILYVNRRALERRLDDILPLYEKWGIKGVKYGFVRVGSQQWTAWLHEAVRKAAGHHLMVDVHDEYRPTGYSRTYPNLMTQEGIRGNECMPTAGENLILPFTRMLAGAGDYTICYYNNRIKTTHAHQLAASVVFYSPWQFVFWYDRPSYYQGEPEIEFFEHLPTVWDDTRVIHGKIGEYIAIARRSGRQWFLGMMNGSQHRSLRIPLTFLEEDKQYVAHIYSDADPGDKTRTHVQISRHIVDSSIVLNAEMPPSGGQAVRLVPAAPDDLTGMFHTPHVRAPVSSVLIRP
jgi:alpha-glucosidase